MFRSKSSNITHRPATHVTESTFATPRGFLSSRNGTLKTSPRIIATARSQPLSLRKNLYPLLHVPRRLFSPERAEAITKAPKLDLRSLRDHISTKLMSANAGRRAEIERILRNEKPHGDSASSRLNDHFLERYAAQDHIYRHDLTGTVHLAPVTARLQGELNRRKGLKCSEELEAVKQQFAPRPPVTLCEPGMNKLPDKPWKAFSAIKHLIQLRVPTMFIPLLGEFVPRRPYQHPHSLSFIQACREGNIDRVRLLLLENRWLALTFDHIKQTGLHWAAKRGHDALVGVLVKAGTFVDSRDCAGRTALYIAARKGQVEVVKALLSLKANPALRSNAGKSPQVVAKSLLAQKLIERAMLLNILLKFAPAERRNEVWEKQGLAYFRSDGEEPHSPTSP